MSHGLKLYLAAPIFTPPQLALVNKLRDEFIRQGIQVFSPYHASQEVWQGRKPADCPPADRRKVLRQNVENLDWCDVLVAVLTREDHGYDGRTDTGVAWEMGGAYAISRSNHSPWPVTVAYVDKLADLPTSGVNLMLAETVDAVCYGQAELFHAVQLLEDHMDDSDEKESVSYLETMRMLYGANRVPAERD